MNAHMWLEQCIPKTMSINDCKYVTTNERTGLTQLLHTLQTTLILLIHTLQSTLILLIHTLQSTLILPATVILYGSKAREDDTIASDVDIIIVASAFHDMHLKQAIRQSIRNINELLDTHIYPRLATLDDLNNPYKYSDNFKANVCQDGIRIGLTCDQ